jgi:hypothetical protein
LLVTTWPGTAPAARIATIVRGVGAGSDKAAGYVAHQMRRAFQADDRYEVIDLEEALGNSASKKAVRAFKVAEQLTDKGREAYQTLDLDPAIEHLASALNKYERNAAFVSDIRAVAKVLMLLGATHILRGDEKTGALRLRQAIAVDPTVDPDPRIFNPGMRQIFQEAVGQLANRPLGTISVTSNPSYAEVYLDGKFVGVTPMAADSIQEGRHFVRFVKEGYRSRGNVIDVVGKEEAADVATLEPTDSFEEFDALVEAATPSLSSKQAGDRVGEVFKQLGQVLEADALMLTEVRLDGERVRVLSVLVDVADSKVLKSASQTFSYDSRPEIYEREVADMLRRNFADDTMAKARQDGVTGSGGGLVHAASGVCYGMPCSKLKTLVLAVGVGGGTIIALLGGLLDYLAFVDNRDYRDSPQSGQEADDLRSSGTAKAISGDILLGLGIITAAASAGLYFFWEPSPSTSDVIEQTDRSWGLAFLPLAGGAAVSAQIEF